LFKGKEIAVVKQLKTEFVSSGFLKEDEFMERISKNQTLILTDAGPKPILSTENLRVLEDFIRQSKKFEGLNFGFTLGTGG
jgi:hypothetical protein